MFKGMKPFAFLFLGVLIACAPLHRTTIEIEETDGDARAGVEAVLDDWHRAASRADGERYFGHMARGAIFIGTDATERWDRDAFQAYADPYFSQGRGWTYEPLERHVYVENDVAWVDERLWNEKYGETRGSGVLHRIGRTWRIVHYVLSLPIPNDLAIEVVERIRSQS